MQLAVVGNPISHSLSPLLHNAVFRALNIKGFYGRYLLENGNDFKSLFALGLSGANVTIPFKEMAYRACSKVFGLAKEVGSVNTVVFSGGEMLGYNTDAFGFFQCLKGFMIKNALIIGAGGTSRALAEILRQNYIHTVITNRSDKKLEHFREVGFEVATFEELKDRLEQTPFDLLINATPAGLVDNALPMHKETLEALMSCSQIAFDLIYGRNTPFLQLARKYHNTEIDGADMLVNQAALSFEIFMSSQDIVVDLQEVVEIMQGVIKLKL